jgi:hypothetical protein
MTDPRIAALAEALASSGVGCATQTCPEHSSKDHAAAILAALPPDWCGHDFNQAARIMVEQAAELARLRASRGRERKPGPGPDPNWPAAIEQCDCAELARLRAIEEAARAVDWESVQDALDVAIHARAEMEVNKVRWRADENALDALRAALGEKP